MINSVRNTVLSVLNKNNYGYISPSDFNLYALQAQMEIWESYFKDFNKNVNAANVRRSGTDYADMAKPLISTLDSFITSNYLVPAPSVGGYATNQFYIPSLITTGDDAYYINKLECYTKKTATGVPSDVATYTLTDTTKNFIALKIAVGDVVVNATTFLATTVATVTSSTVLALNDDIFLNTTDTYSIFDKTKFEQADAVSANKISMLNASPLTAPSNTFPAFYQKSDKVNVYPDTIQGYGAVFATYFRYPYAPKWTYSTLTSGEPVFNASQPDYQDFELPQDAEYGLVVKILEYCGISIRETEVAQFAMAAEQQQKANN
jgi:hypothetical protein